MQGKSLPGDETGTWQVGECVDHGDQQRDDHYTGIYDVQLGAEVHLKPKVSHNKKQWHLTEGLRLFSDTLLVTPYPKDQSNICHTFPVQLPLQNFLFWKSVPAYTGLWQCLHHLFKHFSFSHFTIKYYINTTN